MKAKEVIHYLDVLKETPKAVYGDWSDGKKNIGGKHRESYFDDYKHHGKIYQDFYLFEKEENNIISFVIGLKEKYDVEQKSGIAELVWIYNIGKLNCEVSYINTGYKNLVEARDLVILKEYQRRGLATALYKFIVNNLNYTIMSDDTQYNGSRLLWNVLSEELDMQVDIVDVNTEEVLEKNIILKHGKEPKDINKKYWSDDSSKINIRFILTRIL